MRRRLFADREPPHHHEKGPPTGKVDLFGGWPLCASGSLRCPGPCLRCRRRRSWVGRAPGVGRIGPNNLTRFRGGRRVERGRCVGLPCVVALPIGDGLWLRPALLVRVSAHRLPPHSLGTPQQDAMPCPAKGKTHACGRLRRYANGRGHVAPAVLFAAFDVFGEATTPRRR